MTQTKKQGEKMVQNKTTPLSKKKEQLFGNISGFSNIYLEEDLKSSLRRCFEILHCNSEEELMISNWIIRDVLNQELGIPLTEEGGKTR